MPGPPWSVEDSLQTTATAVPAGFTDGRPADVQSGSSMIRRGCSPPDPAAQSSSVPVSESALR